MREGRSTEKIWSGQIVKTVVETCIVLLIKIGVIEQELPQFPAPMPASRGLTNHSFEKRSFVPVVVTVHAPFVDVNAAANVDPHTGFEPKFSVQGYF